MLLHVLNPSSDFTEPEAYPALSHVIHSTLARVALAEGQRDIVAAERAQCDKLLPADINSVLKLVPRLRSGGMPEMADQVLDRALAVHRQIISEFPTSATYRNDAAWMAARCQRKLDEAPLGRKRRPVWRRTSRRIMTHWPKFTSSAATAKRPWPRLKRPSIYRRKTRSSLSG